MVAEVNVGFPCSSLGRAAIFGHQNLLVCIDDCWFQTVEGDCSWAATEIDDEILLFLLDHMGRPILGSLQWSS